MKLLASDARPGVETSTGAAAQSKAVQTAKAKSDNQ